MAKSKKDTLALFEVMHKDKGQDPLKLPPRSRVAGSPDPAAPLKKGIWLRLTPGHVLVVVGLVIAIALAAYFAGRQDPVPQDGPASEDILRGPASPQVLEPRGAAANPEAPPMTGVSEATGAGGAGVDAADGKRTVGLTYVVVQSYPTADAAGEIRDYLTRAGIGCTVEKGHPFAPKWYCVISTRGFPRVSSREYDDYVRQLRAVANRYPGPKFMKSEPQPYKWR